MEFIFAVLSIEAAFNKCSGGKLSAEIINRDIWVKEAFKGSLILYCYTAPVVQQMHFRMPA